jgi:prepilin-type N-terminal cleavage/methylation domain-containing protein
MLTGNARSGFTLVEVIVALLILSTAVLGLAGSASRLATTSATAELRALALQSVEDRLARIRMDPRYGGLDTLYSGVESGLFAIEGITRTTTVTHVQQTTPLVLDYTRISVTVEGTLLSEPISRQIVIAAP